MRGADPHMKLMILFEDASVKGSKRGAIFDRKNCIFPLTVAHPSFLLVWKDSP